MRTLSKLFCLVLLTSCYKDENSEVINQVASDCQELGTAPLQGWNYIVDSASYLYPCFNPNNPNEIIFTHKEYGNGLTRLYRYDLISHQKTLLHIGDQNFAPNWGSNNWILMNLSGNSVWKVKPDGTELTQLINSGNDFYPIWRSDCAFFSAFRGFFTDNLQKSILYTSDGTAIDTLQNTGLGSTSDWRDDGLSCSMGGYGPKVSDINNDVVIYYDSAQYNFSGGSRWLNEFEFIWSDECGIYKTNYVTGEKTLVKESCRTRNYQDPTYHPLINKIIWTRVELNQVNNFDIEVKSRLFIMNPDGTEETEIIIQ